MALFTKKRPPEDLPVIDTETQNDIVAFAQSVINSAKGIYACSQRVPGLIDYATTNLIPRLASAGMMGDIDKAIGILAADAVLATTIALIARSIKGDSSGS
jgi:hypothetical protein